MSRIVQTKKHKVYISRFDYPNNRHIIFCYTKYYTKAQFYFVLLYNNFFKPKL
ncbi:hypothetical protein C1646_686973 [Rhizophagus diaphanus]|nr:hypothetical protein C1646_686973 [Rhizophagus diaphanus] [Rhizophagus sp. MUCL 43196]